MSILLLRLVYARPYCQIIVLDYEYVWDSGKTDKGDNDFGRFKPNVF